MYNKLAAFARQHGMFSPGDRVICAVSGGADSVALLFAMYLLKDQLGITLEAAHYDHGLRGRESEEDAAFVRTLCDRYDIPLHEASGKVVAGPKGLEAAARDARYAFLRSLPGTIATAHTADDNAETVLMHLVRGTGLKGLGGITPVAGKVVRPMLGITRQEVEAFLEEYCLSSRLDSSNCSDRFLRNRLRHRVMPVLREENPRLAVSVSAMALRLRQDEDLIRSLLPEQMPGVKALREMHPALCSRLLERFLRESGVTEPDQSHIAQARSLVFSENPSARAAFPGGVTLAREYDRLVVLPREEALEELLLEDRLVLPQLGLTVTATREEVPVSGPLAFTVAVSGPIRVRSRLPGDTIRLGGGTKSLKKLFIDKKIPASQRARIPVVADDKGVLGIYGIGANLDRLTEADGITIRFEKIY